MGTGGAARFFFNFIVAAPAVVAHFVNIITRCGVGLRRHNAVIGGLTHTAGIWQLDPLNGINVDA